MDVVVIGGGIAGVSAAYEIAAQHTVTLLEQEPHLAYHTTGRSAALFTENYGDGTIRPLTAASRAFFDTPPPGFTDHPILTPRGALTVGRPDQVDQARHLFEEAHARSERVEWIDATQAAAMCPSLRADLIAAAVWEPDAADIDVATLHQGFVKGLRARGGEILVSRRLNHGTKTSQGWALDIEGGRLGADLLVNAGGAWGDVVAADSGIRPIGLAPLRRTAFMVSAPAGADTWPMVIGADEEYYFKPDGGQLLCSPADETPSAPVDARPQEVDVAIAIDRINAVTTLGLRHVRSQWAGLRTFAPDRSMVIGRDPDEPAFVWLVGQGGTGIQSAPAAARVVVATINDEPVPDDVLAAGLDPRSLDPGRARTSTHDPPAGPAVY